MEDKRIADLDETIEYYENNATDYIQATLHADVSGLYKPFEDLLPPRARILDLGCGSGRDSKYFVDQGYDVVAIDPVLSMCEQTRSMVDIPVLQMRAQQIDFWNEFDGVWACASMLHIKRDDQEKTLCRIADSLKIGGVLYSSWKYGDIDRVVDGRRFTDFTESSFKELLDKLNVFDAIRIWITQDVREDNKNQKWLNVLLKKNCKTSRMLLPKVRD